MSPVLPSLNTFKINCHQSCKEYWTKLQIREILGFFIRFEWFVVSIIITYYEFFSALWCLVLTSLLWLTLFNIHMFVCLLWLCIPKMFVCLFDDKFVVTAHSIRVCYKWALLDIIQQFLDSPWGDSHCPLIGPQQSLTVLPLVVRAPPPADH